MVGLPSKKCPLTIRSRVLGNPFLANSWMIPWSKFQSGKKVAGSARGCHALETGRPKPQKWVTREGDSSNLQFGNGSEQICAGFTIDPDSPIRYLSNLLAIGPRQALLFHHPSRTPSHLQVQQIRDHHGSDAA